MGPFISIIIPTYNSGKTLGSCLDSIVSQDYRAIEICIIDGQSTDQTIEIIEQYQKQYQFIHYISEKDQGIYDAMNKGIDRAKGEWLYFLGSDDTLFNSTVFTEIVGIINKNPRYLFFYGNVKMIGDTMWAKDGSVYAGFFDLTKILKHNISHQAIFYHKKLFAIHRNYNIKYKICADYDLNLDIFSKFPIRYANIVISNYRGGGLSSQITDVLFSNDYYKNIIQYFLKSLYKSQFKHIESHIIQQGKIDIQNFRFVRGLYLSGIGYRFKIIRHLCNRFSL